ncbi:uncharacterized protein LOC115237356 [Formica exsecta]|uniref:uncharacterized protein LOC115237356 n=1 Tax=Formica exsecta TaxID=72781 RepID=UPI0011412135|nr:uncharacterized protein LOC115237356 [Formica exsecta]
MCGNSLTFCMLLLIVSSLAFQSSSTNDDNKDNNLTVREYTKRNYDKKAELRKNDTNDNKDYCMMIIKIRKSQSLNHIVLREMCDNITYIRILCCPLNNCSIHKNCIAKENEYVCSNGYNYSNDSMQNENKKVDEFCPLIVQNPRQLNCSQKKHFSYPYFKFIEITKYYLTNVHDDQFNASICLKAANEIFHKEMDKIIKDLTNEILSTELTISFYSNIVSMLCLILIFLVYSTLPELRNIHNFMLRRSISMIFIVYTIEVIDYLFNIKGQKNSICVISALVWYFCNLTSDFWLNVISFDMWWTFR